MSSSNSPRNINSDSQETEKNPDNKKEVEDIPIKNTLSIKKLYPSLSFDGKIAKNLLLSKEEEPGFKRNKASFIMEEKENPDILSENFLKELVKKPCTLDKSLIIRVMTEFIQSSPLIQKLQKDAQMDKKVENNELSKMGAANLSYMELKKGQVLFRIGDNGDRFYFILSGRVSILKLKEINNVQMTYFEYLDYCMHLICQKEYYIFNKVKNRNMKIISISSESEVISIYKIFFMKKLKEAILGEKVPDTKSLMKYLKTYGFKLQDFNIKISNLEKIENNPNLEPEYKMEEWKEYLIKKCKPSMNDLMLYEYYKNLFQKDETTKKPFTCFAYKPFLFLGKGLFFGDFALDSDMNKRNATIRAEENTILAYMKSADYINIFAPKRRFEKMKEINFLYTNYFFGNINLRSFEKHYFHLFSPHEFFRNHELFDFGSFQEGLILLKQGKVCLEIKASIADLHDLIKYLWVNLEKNKYFQDLTFTQKNTLITPSIEKRIMDYIDEPIFTKLKSFGDKFLEEINRIKIFQVYIFANKEIIGLEEYYMGFPYMMRGTVYGNKISCYQIDKESFENILTQEKQIIFQYVKSSVNKIISLIDRLQSLKINQIKIYKNKFDEEVSDFIELNKMNAENINKTNIEVNSYKDISNNNGINSQNKFILSNKIYKSPVKSISTNLNPLVQFISIKNKKQNKKINNSISSLSMDKNTSLSTAQYNKNDSLLQKYNSYIFQKINESKANNASTNEENHSENNISTTKNDNQNAILSNSNNITKKKNKIKLQFNSQRSFSYNNILNKLNNNIKFKPQSLSGLNQKDKILSNKISLIKNNSSIMRYSPERQKVFVYRNYYFNKKPRKNLFEKENTNDPKINSIWFNQKTRELKTLKNNSINDFIIKNNRDNDEINSLIENNNPSINNILEEDKKNKKIAISNAIKDFYNNIKNRGYSSFVRNKKSNTILNRKNKRKYLSNFSISVSTSVANQNKSEQNQNKKISAKLPLIKDKTNIIFS